MRALTASPGETGSIRLEDEPAEEGGLLLAEGLLGYASRWCSKIVAATRAAAV